MSDVYLFSIRASQINYLLRGVQSFKTMDILPRGRIYYYWRGSTHFTEYLCSGLANRRIISINSKYRARHNWNQNPEGEHFHIKSLTDHKGVLEYLFSQIDIYLLLLISKVLEF